MAIASGKLIIALALAAVVGVAVFRAAAVENADSPAVLSLPAAEWSLSPLPLPSEELGEMLAGMADIHSDETGFSASTLFDLRKSVKGEIVFEAAGRTLSRSRPAETGVSALFPGAQPSAPHSGGALAFIDRNATASKLAIYDFIQGKPKTIFSTLDALARPALSPDASSAAVTKVSLSSLERKLLIIKASDGSSLAPRLTADFHSAAWNPADGSLWVALKKCPPGDGSPRLCFDRADSARGAVSNAFISLKQADGNGDLPSFSAMRSAAFSFSPSGEKILVYDERSADGFFYVADIVSGETSKKHFKSPTGSAIQFDSLAWGRDDDSFVFTYLGNIWVKLSDESIPPFPAIIEAAAAASPPLWLP